MGGQRLADLRARLGDAMAANEARGWTSDRGGESPREVQARVSPLLREIAAQGLPVRAESSRRDPRRVRRGDRLGHARQAASTLDWSCVQVFRLDGRGASRADALNVALEPRTPMEGSP